MKRPPLQTCFNVFLSASSKKSVSNVWLLLQFGKCKGKVRRCWGRRPSCAQFWAWPFRSKHKQRRWDEEGDPSFFPLVILAHTPFVHSSHLTPLSTHKLDKPCLQSQSCAVVHPWVSTTDWRLSVSSPSICLHVRQTNFLPFHGSCYTFVWQTDWWEREREGKAVEAKSKRGRGYIPCSSFRHSPGTKIHIGEGGVIFFLSFHFPPSFPSPLSTHTLLPNSRLK